MLHFSYLASLFVAISGLAALDRRYRLAFWRDRRRTALTLLLGMAVFVAWDAAGIGLGIFFDGGSPYASHLHLAPEFPVEELFFLFLLCYLTLLLYRGGKRWC